MILESKSICKKVSDENNLDLDLLSSINHIIFKEVYQWTKNPVSLRVYLKHFGSWYFKKQKTASKLELYQNLLDNNRAYSEKDKDRMINKIKNYSFILSEYIDYTKSRYEVKCQKYGKEAYKAFCMAKKQEKIQKSQKNKPLEHT